MCRTLATPPGENPDLILLPMTTPRAVVFDMDGLMFNTEDVYWEVGTELLRRRGHVFTRELADEMTGRPPRESFDVMIRWHSLSDPWEKLAAETEELYLDLLGRLAAPMPGLVELLEALEAAGIPKAIGTSSDGHLAAATLSHFGMENRFQFVLTAEDITHGKPHPEIYLEAAARLGLPPREILVLEDSQIGCRAAAAAGAVTVGVPGAHTRDHDFSAAALVLESLADPRLYELLELRPRAK